VIVIMRPGEIRGMSGLTVCELTKATPRCEAEETKKLKK
jgi:hypothetical protein